jgi:hypothetical protein
MWIIPQILYGENINTYRFVVILKIKTTAQNYMSVFERREDGIIGKW